MKLTKKPPAPPIEPYVAAVEGGAAYMTDLERRLAPCVARAEPRQRALGDALLDRALDVPKAWADDQSRCRQAGSPAAHRLRTKPQLTQARLARASAAGVPASWVTGESV